MSEQTDIEAKLDEIIALAADAGRLSDRAFIATADRGRARKAYTEAKRKLSAARARFLNARREGSK